jgi:hypothetical protein
VTLQSKSFVLNQEEEETRRGRSKLRFCDEVEEDITQVGCRNWRINAQTRHDWRKLTEGVKCQPGM